MSALSEVRLGTGLPVRDWRSYHRSAAAEEVGFDFLGVGDSQNLCPSAASVGRLAVRPLS